MVPVPRDAQFPEHYQMSMQAVHRAFKRVIDRLPNAEAGELRQLDSERLEEMFLSLQPGIRQGEVFRRVSECWRKMPRSTATKRPRASISPVRVSTWSFSSRPRMLKRWLTSVV